MSRFLAGLAWTIAVTKRRIGKWPMAGRGPVSAKLLFISIFMWVVVCLTNSIQPVYFGLLPRIGSLENELVAALGIVLTVVGPAVTFVGFVSMKESFRIGIVDTRTGRRLAVLPTLARWIGVLADHIVVRHARTVSVAVVDRA